jgi:hypothetical protein
MRTISIIEDQEVIDKILGHLGLSLPYQSATSSFGGVDC